MNMFTGWFEGIHSSCLELHFSTWHDPSLALVQSIQIESILHIFESMFPIYASVLSIVSNAGGNNIQAKRKKYLSLQYFYQCVD